MVGTKAYAGQLLAAQTSQKLDGLEEGDKDGALEGDEDGADEGEVDGTLDGAAEGISDGHAPQAINASPLSSSISSNLRLEQ